MHRLSVALGCVSAAFSIILGMTASALITVGALDTPGSAQDVVVVGDLAYVVDTYSGVRIIVLPRPSPVQAERALRREGKR